MAGNSETICCDMQAQCSAPSKTLEVSDDEMSKCAACIRTVVEITSKHFFHKNPLERESTWVVDDVSSYEKQRLQNGEHYLTRLCANFERYRHAFFDPASWAQDESDDVSIDIVQTPEEAQMSTDLELLRRDMLLDPVYVIQAAAYALSFKFSLRIVMQTLEHYPSVLDAIFTRLLRNTSSPLPFGGMDALCMHVWVASLSRVLASAKFMTCPLIPAQGERSSCAEMMPTWFLALCANNMHQTLRLLWRIDSVSIAELVSRVADTEDLHGGPIACACSGNLTNTGEEQARESVRAISDILDGCMRLPLMKAASELSLQYLQSQWGGVALLYLARTETNLARLERIITRVLEWCNQPLMNLVDHKGYTALAYIIERGGPTELCVELVRQGASLLIEVGEKELKAQEESQRSWSKCGAGPLDNVQFVEVDPIKEKQSGGMNNMRMDEILQRRYRNERVLMRRIIAKPKTDSHLRSRQLAAYRAAWNVKQQELAKLVGDIVRQDIQHQEADLYSTDGPYLRVYLTNLGVTPRSNKRIFYADGEDASGSLIPPHIYERQQARIITGAELHGRYSGEIYDQYEMEATEGWLVRQPQTTTVFPGMMYNIQVVLQNPNPMSSTCPSTVMITLKGTGDPLDMHLPNFSPTTVVFHTQNYLSFCGICSPSMDSICDESGKIVNGMGYEMYNLSGSAGFFRAERVGSGAAAMPFRSTIGLMSKNLDGDDKKNADENPEDASGTQSVDMSKFVQVIHWARDPMPSHLVLGRMNVVSLLAPVNFEIDGAVPPTAKKQNDVVSSDATAPPADVDGTESAQEPMSTALKFTSLVFDITIISRAASDILECQLALQEDKRLEEVLRQEELEKERKEQRDCSVTGDEMCVSEDDDSNPDEDTEDPLVMQSTTEKDVVLG